VRYFFINKKLVMAAKDNWLFSTLCDNFCLWNREILIG
jgi:hypothetical protein